MSPSNLHLASALLTALTLGVIDHRSGRMPNVLTMSSMACALMVGLFLSGVPGVLHALLGLFLVGFVPALLFFTTGGRGIGGGDVKALAALGAWLGPLRGLEVEFLAFLLLALFALTSEARKGRLVALLGRSLSLLLPSALRMRSTRMTKQETREDTAMTFVRFGPFLALGTALSVGASWWEAPAQLLWALL